MQLTDIVKRVQAKVDDLDGTYCDADYVAAFVQDAYEWLYNKLRLTGYQFDENRVLLPAVPAGVPDLSSYQAAGNPLATLVQPRIIEWKLPGQDDTYYQRANGPLDEVRDVPVTLMVLDSWSWNRWVIQLSKFGQALDLRITGDFLFDPLTSPDSQVNIAVNANRVLASKLASEIGKARGQDKFKVDYGLDADEALDDLAIAMSKADQAKTHRVGRMSRANYGANYSTSSY